MSKRNIFVIVFILFTVLVLSSSNAQTCSTGHFVFEVSDSWKFMTYDEFMIYNTQNDCSLWVLERDYTEYEVFSRNRIVDFYLSLIEGNEYSIFEINGDLYAYYIEELTYSSFPQYSCTLLAYKNGYVLYLQYAADSLVTKEQCIETILKISKTISYSVQEPTTYSISKKFTDHFIYGVPNGWFHVSNESGEYYYGGTEMSAKGGMYFVIEWPLSDLGYDSTSDKVLMYQEIANNLYEELSTLSELTTEEITINGLPAYSSKFILNLYSGYVYQTLLSYGDYLMVATYMNSDDCVDPNYSVTVVEALNSYIKPLYYY